MEWRRCLPRFGVLSPFFAVAVERVGSCTGLSPARFGRHWLDYGFAEDGGLTASACFLHRLRRRPATPGSVKLWGASPPVCLIVNVPRQSQRASDERHKAAWLRGASSELDSAGISSFSASADRRRAEGLCGRAGGRRDLDGFFSYFLLARVVSVKFPVSWLRWMVGEIVGVSGSCTVLII